MRCVSYTRFTASDPDIESTLRTITGQNQAIADYAAGKGWKIEKKYSDRKEDPQALTGFQKLKEDGIQRKFDLVVIRSLSQCGLDETHAARVLGKVFYPSGIHFAVTEDEFCSLEKTAEEVDAYLKNTRLRREYNMMKTEDGPKPFMPCKARGYAYSYDPAERKIQVHAKAAETVKEIFQRIGKESAGEIATDLNLRGVEAPYDFFRRVNGWDPKGTSTWRENAIMKIAKDVRYSGDWSGETYELAEIPPAIVDPELAEEVRELLRKNENKNMTRVGERKKAPLFLMVYDKATATRMQKRVKRGTPVFRLSEGKDEEGAPHSYDIPYEYVYRKVKDLLLKEIAFCRKADEWISSASCQEYLEEKKKEMRKTVPALLQEVYELQTARIQRLQKQGAMTEDETLREREEHLKEFAYIAGQLETIAEAIKEWEFTFSENNPWLAQFHGAEEESLMTIKTLRKYFHRIYVTEDGEVEPVWKEDMEWKVFLLKEMETREEEDGQKK